MARAMPVPASEQPVVGRLAPSPTGLLHLGHARTFLLAWWSARARGGRIVLRIDDLDGERATREFADAACRDLEWLGLDWDGPPYFESSGLPRMRQAIDELLAAGRAFVCTCSRGDVRQAQSAPHEGAAEARYPGTCRGRWSSLEEAERTSGRRAGVRLLVADGAVHFEDLVAGPQSFEVAAEVGDFLIARRGGAPAYQLAVVIDDTLQGVNEVVRGDDLLASTARQQLLQAALGLTSPRWAHVPLVTNAADQRLAKREAALGLWQLCQRGVDPRRIVGWAARSAGIDAGEVVTPAEVSRGFSIDRIRRERVVAPELLGERSDQGSETR
jgi:glutamyl-tRNA synthetase